MGLLIFRIILVFSFLLVAWRWGDWRNWQRYYPTILFVMVINLSAGFLSYHHSLWNYSKDILVTTETIIEFVNTYINLPATILVYLSLFPSHGKMRKAIYVGIWAVIYGTLEFIDHYVFGGIFYTNGWTWSRAVIFDIIMFCIIRAHYLNPWKGWLLSFIVAALIIIQFGFITGEMK